ncbi:MAG: hypothetical protein GX616_01130, partial [Planctomycetes bacterium]|nr:hypothetical protein [Planctomycetota bacterium]
IPATWLSRGEMAGLLSVFLAVNGTGCSKDQPAGSSARPPANDLAGKAAIVAPIFEHGEGRGATGCIVVNPPVFLSEEEALQVITEELQQAGLHFSQRDVPMDDVSIPLRIEVQREDWVTGCAGLTAKPARTQTKSLNLDLLDSTRFVAVEFVSQSDHGDARANYDDTDDTTITLWSSSVQDYDFRDTAAWIAKYAGEQGRGLRLGVFYDPLERPRPKVDPRPTSASAKTQDDTDDLAALVREWGRVMKMTREEHLVESKRLLRLQAKDFVDWLKGQGVI